ncbi:MAG: bifunctional aspartate kinase/homoserine dehydrogenase I [Kangiellaceae bacterium]
MKVLKFGGSSLATAKKILSVVSIIENQFSAAAQEITSTSSVAIVVSAPGGVTNQLVNLVRSLNDKSETEYLLEDLKSNIFKITLGIEKEFPSNDSLSSLVERQFERIYKLVEGVKLIGHCPEQTEAQILTFGERLSILFLNWIFTQKKVDVTLIEPEKFLVAENQTGDTLANLPLSKEKFCQQYENFQSISLMPGFVGISNNNTTITLGRNGSDYSAAILAVCINAKICEIWTDVDGVYNADPRLVSDAELVKQMTFNEAIELSYFGAKILHPKTITPLCLNDIPCLIKNSLAPERAGTLISKEANNEIKVKAIASLDNVAMLNVSGPGMKAKLGLTNRIFAALDKAKVQVILISQSSAAYRISLCISCEQAQLAEDCLNDEFELELKNLRVDPIQVMKDLSVVSLVGDQMQQQKGIAAKFFSSLSQAGVNIIAIAQDSSERSISAVVRSHRTDDAVSVCHRNLFLQRASIDAFILGCGTVGSELLEQIRRQQKFLLEKNIDLVVYGIASSKKLLLNNKGIDLNGEWHNQLKSSDDKFSIERLKEFVEDNHLLNPVVVDVTSNQAIALQSEQILQSKFHLVAANKKANTASFDYYQKLRTAAQQNKRRFLYETNVGAGLPVIDNLQSLLRAGDELEVFEGILSGSLSYIFGLLHEGLSLSQATLQAQGLGYTEPNPAEDLSGLDVARKVLIIAREAGFNLELGDIELESVVPEKLATEEDSSEFLKQLPDIDLAFDRRVKKAESENKVLRYVAKIVDGKCRVGIQAVEIAHPLYAVKNGENAIAMHTRYYNPTPFVIRGYGAGAAVTAAGLFADLLRTVVWDLE